ncbi:MAG: hypothetical protein K6A96_03510, partial [Prevotella sp.]|nr:hypothetical protein [Prevotella sp.]
ELATKDSHVPSREVSSVNSFAKIAKKYRITATLREKILKKCKLQVAIPPSPSNWPQTKGKSRNSTKGAAG